MWKLRLNVCLTHSCGFLVGKEISALLPRREKYGRSITLCSLPPIHHFFGQRKLGIWFTYLLYFWWVYLQESKSEKAKSKDFLLWHWFFSPKSLRIFYKNIFYKNISYIFSPKSFHIFILGYLISRVLNNLDYMNHSVNQYTDRQIENRTLILIFVTDFQHFENKLILIYSIIFSVYF